MATTLQNDLANNSISNISLSYDGSTITLPSVTLASADDMSFEAVIRQLDVDTVQMDVTGRNDQITRTIRVNCSIEPERHPVFDYGIATKGPLYVQGNANVEGLNESIEADVYIESQNNPNALTMIGSSAIEGDVRIVNPDATPAVSNPSSVGDETGQDAIDNHVTIGVSSTGFPVPELSAFEDYVENIFDPDTDTTTDVTLENIRILASTNPHFSGGVVVRGIMFIESPNIVTFTGNASITGIIIGNGDIDSPSEENQLIFGGTVDSHSVSELGEEFGDIGQETGTFLLAPGFSASFGGNFETISGAIAASGIDFFGNTGGTINGSVINYADTPMNITGSPNLVFNRPETDERPAGFESSMVLEFLPSSYLELPL